MSTKVSSATIIISCTEFDEALIFFTNEIGFRVSEIYPADDPSTAVMVGFGLQLTLILNGLNDFTVLRLYHSPNDLQPDSSIANGAQSGNILKNNNENRTLVAPNGTLIIFAELPTDDYEMPPLVQTGVITNLLSPIDGEVSGNNKEQWNTGRAGMQYRDLIPGRLGGRYIASHIAIPTAGLVPDYVHYHNVKFQMIYCMKGWVKVVYEDQGMPFTMHAGDCVLQPPGIRHRVLESGEGLEVLELGSPAVHRTFADFDMTLPNSANNNALIDKEAEGVSNSHGEGKDGVLYGANEFSSREWKGQQFVRHVCSRAAWITARSFPRCSGEYWWFQTQDDVDEGTEIDKYSGDMPIIEGSNLQVNKEDTGADEWEVRDTGIGSATNGLAQVLVIRSFLRVETLNNDSSSTSSVVRTSCQQSWKHHDSELLFLFVLHGQVEFSVLLPETEPLNSTSSNHTANDTNTSGDEIGISNTTGTPKNHKLTRGSSISIPRHAQFKCTMRSADAELLQVMVW